MPGTEILLCIVGAFYAFAGFAATRAALMSLFLDRAIAAIGGQKPARSETVKGCWLLAAAGVILAGGLALLFLLDVAFWLFAGSAAAQALYLLYLAPRFFDVEDEPDAAGRRQTVTAFAIYLASTALVAWAYAHGRLVETGEAHWWAIAIPAALLLAHAAYVARALAGNPKSPFDGQGASADDDDDERDRSE